MCWSFEVSTVFALLEAAAIGFLFVRAKASSDHYVRAQVLILPACITVFCVELVEAMLWQEEGLVSVLEAASSSSFNSTTSTINSHPSQCSQRNQLLTFLLGAVILPIQPFVILFPMRRVGFKRNLDLIRIPEIGAATFALVWSAGMVVAAFWKDAPVTTLGASNFRGILHQETCTFLGRYGGHLQWAFRNVDFYLFPNASGYFLTLVPPVFFVRPWSFYSGIMVLIFVQFVTTVLYFRFSFEFGSVWCWSALTMFVYLILQPYILPFPKMAEEESLKEHPITSWLLKTRRTSAARKKVW